MIHTIISWYSGHRGSEYPLVFCFAGKEFRTKKLLSEKLIEEKGTQRRKRAFLIRTDEGQLFEILVGETVEIRQKIPPE